MHREMSVAENIAEMEFHINADKAMSRYRRVKLSIALANLRDELYHLGIDVGYNFEEEGE